MTEQGPGFDPVIAAQASSHGEGHDYVAGSPHLRHATLRDMVERRLQTVVSEIIGRKGGCRALEIGGGHGTFSSYLADAGASLTVTEASPASAAVLRRILADRPDAEVRLDDTGERILESGETWDLVVMTAVLHHIPDYVGYLNRLVDLIAEDGALFTAQDPLYYPRLSPLHHRAQRATYLAWRLFQGNYARGLATRMRRVTGTYSDTEESDLVEYHVVRDGVDEQAIVTAMSDHFETVDVFTYWSTQAPIFQRLGERMALRSEFGIEARGRRRS
ncbi:class I SAM-dependent methyltransferase [Nocardioides albidus]|uniref:Class I SAM-dependent methyltransferase n=1 Tax=Nocardioides albidus TaxID=1517589 RepID=A0A5C4W9W2_9ACTN|nr:class I SAM-dependent methyltransferase [Nocardioides albidus]TNM44129.1 class I SAM-dependent methyltransferase [Nocardioides albidus]